MRLFALRKPPGPVLAGGGLHLRQPTMDDFPAWQQLRRDSAAFLLPWEPRWPSDDLTRTGFRRRLDRYRRDSQSMSALTWFLFDDAERLLGGISLSNIRIGASRSGQIGYWMGEAHAGRGFMSRAVRLVLAEAFGPLRLERVEAACLPHNERSIRLLEAVGFFREGYLRGYLEINGERRDHVLYAILRSDFMESGLQPAARRNIAQFEN